MEERRGPRELMSQTRGWHNLGLWRQRGPQVSYLGGLWGSQSVRSGWKQGQDSCSQCVYLCMDVYVDYLYIFI